MTDPIESNHKKFSWKFHVGILVGAGLILSVGAWVRYAISHRPEQKEGSVLQVLQTEVQQLKASLRRNELMAIQEMVSSATTKAFPTVVSIRSSQMPMPPRPVITLNDYRAEQNRLSSDGDALIPGISGLLLDQEGYILTSVNAYELGLEFEVLMEPDRRLTAVLVAYDQFEHLALLKLQQNDALPSTPDLTATPPPLTGSWLVRLGRTPRGQMSLALGIVESIRRDAAGRESYFLSADMAPELDGSPVINMDGRIVGLNVLLPNRSYTVPIEHALNVYRTLKQKSFAAPQSWIGVEVQELTDELKSALQVGQGVLITRITANSPAQKAGLQPLNVVTNINDQPIQHARELIDLIHRTPAGTKLTIKAMQAGKEKLLEIETIPFQIGSSQPNVIIEGGFGMDLSRIPSTGGVEIIRVRNNSRVHQLGLRAGDQIISINGTPITSNVEFERKIQSLPPKAIQLWLIRRGDQTYGLTLKEGALTQ